MRRTRHAALALCLAIGLNAQAGDLETAGMKHFDSNGVEIHYSMAGSGSPVLLIHGLGASAQMNWGAPGILKALQERYQVIAMDVRGHGSSDKPDNPQAYGLEMVKDVMRLLDHLKIKKAHIIGYSMGGMIAMKFATQHPERVQSLALGGMGWLREGSNLQDFWNRLPERKTAWSPAVAARSFGALAVTEADLKAIRLPVAVFVGDRDPVRNMYVVPLQPVRPDWPVTVIDDAGHMNCIFKPQFKEALKKWLDSQPSGAPGKSIERVPKSQEPTSEGSDLLNCVLLLC